MSCKGIFRKAVATKEQKARRWNSIILLSNFVVMIVTSCTESPLLQMGRSSNDPTIIMPTVQSFARENEVWISWPADSHSDSYILQRSLDVKNPIFETLYTGRTTRWVDSKKLDAGIVAERYLYRLIKKRGTKLFPDSGNQTGSDLWSFGILSSIKEDDLEPNNEKEQATRLLTRTRGNLHLFKSEALQDRNEVADIDWFVVNIQEGYTITISILQTNPEITANQNTYIKIAWETQAPEQVTQGGEISLENTDNVAKDFRFRLLINPETPVPVDSGGGIILSYQVILTKIEAP